MASDPAVSDDAAADDRADTGSGEAGDESRDGTTGGDESQGDPDRVADPVEARLDDALERVAHGATVSVPSILVQRGLTLAFTAVLTNGFAASSYGVFAVARRLQQFLLHVTLGFRSGLSRFLPNADSADRKSVV